MKRSFLIISLLGTLAMTACTSSVSPTPESAVKPSTPVQLEERYVLDLHKESGSNLRLWVNFYQTGTVFTGWGNAGYLTPEGRWIEPYSGKLTGQIDGNKVRFTLGIHDYYDTNQDVTYEFVGTMQDKLSGTWTRVSTMGFGASGSGDFDAEPSPN